jgi:pimeloyl-ACP methyl ester carboxylesterase
VEASINATIQLTCLIIPGYSEKTVYAPYDMARYMLEKIGWRVVPCDIDWDGHVMTDWLTQARPVLTAEAHLEMIIGFSMGAMMSLILATEYEVGTIIACSPSPYFSEDLADPHPGALRVFGESRMKDFSNYSRSNLAKVRASSVESIIGANESPKMFESYELLQDILRDKINSQVLPDAPHQFGHEFYLPHVLLTIARCSKAFSGFQPPI